MKLKNYLTILICALLSTLSFTACSSDDDEEGLNGSLTIDGETYRVEMASCSNGVQEEYADAGCFFEAMLGGSEDTYYFTVELVGKYNLNNLKSGEDVSDIASVYSFHRISNVDFSRFEDTDGKVIIKSTSNNSITLEFKNYTFNRRGSNVSYVINGLIEYEK